MTTIILRKAPIRKPTGNPDRDRVLRAWLLAVAGLVMGMVVLGGLTRLTQSGLSITEWQPIHGVIPPLDAAAWQEEFDKYKTIPEYLAINSGMTLDEFKTIFWWEWTHRLVGRLVGVVFLLPFLVFLATGRLRRDRWRPFAGVFALGGLQGVVGWWMVSSGLAVRTDVSQYRLATHLTLAAIILVLLIALSERYRDQRSSYYEPASLRRGAYVLVVAILVQMFLGAIVAGLDAGLLYNSWPLMEGRIVPHGLFAQSPVWLNPFENRLTAQFDHRLGAYAVLALAAFHVVDARVHAVDPLTVRRAGIVLALIGLQAVFGIATLIFVVPLPLAVLHQAMAVVVLTAATVHACRTLSAADF